MKILHIILISLVTSVLLLVGFLNIPPQLLKYASISHYFPKLGTSVTTISTATNLADFPAIYNADIPALNAGKIEISTTTLPLITTLENLVTTGALSSGSLTSGFTTVNVAQGGTGSSTLSQYQVLLGNGTSGLTTPSGWGTSGQFLTSQGAGSLPIWQTASVNQTTDYTWTGRHSFESNVYLANLNASSTVIFNGVSLAFPATQGASSTQLKNDGSGNLTWNEDDWVILGEDVLTGANGTTSVTFTARKDLRIVFDTPGASGAAINALLFNTDLAGNNTNYAYNTFKNYTFVNKNNGTNRIELDTAGTSTPQSFVTDIINNRAATTKRFTYRKTTGGGGINTDIRTGMAIWNNTSDQITTVYVTTGVAGVTFNAGTRLVVYGSRD